MPLQIVRQNTHGSGCGGQTAKNAGSALQHGEITLKEIEGFISEDSPVRIDLTNSLEELSAAARSMRTCRIRIETNRQKQVTSGH